MAGYSATPLQKKLGIRDGFKIFLGNAPENYFSLLGKHSDEVKTVPASSSDVDFIHLFVTSEKELNKQLPLLKKKMSQSGMIWVSWYKKSSGIPTDVTEDSIREAAFPLGLVDVKVCAVDEQW